ncbi:MAG TPA: CHASE2 domain-containing protein [Methylophilaceae bacterium]|nr:CHASE2 domain-containing protein [Methylophilaceae bacterium]
MPPKLPRLLPHSVVVLVVVTSLLAAVAFYSPQGRLLQLNRLIQDLAVASHGMVPHDDIIIVAIDHSSIEKLGRWPWRRAVHAELLNRIGEGQPKAIGLDVLFIEEDLNHPQDDDLLATSLLRNRPVVLPVFIQQKGSDGWVILPQPELAKNAAGLGQAHLKVDTDGIVRSIYRALPAQGQLWSPFAVEIMKAAHDAEHQPDGESFTTPLTPADGTDAIIIPFAGGPGYFSRISYIDVLHGKVPAERFKDKYVLVGATAEGMADLYATPTIGEARMMPGVEVLANVIDSMMHSRSIKTVSPLLNAAMNVSFVLLTFIGLIFLQPLRALLFALGLSAVLLSITYLGVGMGWMLNPAAGVIGIVATYVLWSWNRLDTAVRFLSAEFETLQQQGIATATTEKRPRLHDFLGRRITALEAATTQLRLLHRFVIDAINTVPYPIFVADLDGVIQIANEAAAQHVQRPSAAGLYGRPLHTLTNDLISTTSGQQVIPAGFQRDWSSDFRDEARDQMGRDLIVKCVPISGIDQRRTGWMLSLVDISELRQAERAREEAFNFIAHDIRAPLSAIIATLELQRLQPDKPDLAKRISQYAEEALLLADGVLNLSRAESGHLSFELMNLADLLREAAEESWVMGKTAGIRFIITGAKEAYVLLDRNLCKRALLNLLSNAVKFSPPHTEVLCTLNQNDDSWELAIKDKGLGFELKRHGDLFMPFKRLHAESHPEIPGTGLGLAFVQVVARRHGGSVKAESQPGKGSTFYFVIPAGKVHQTPAASVIDSGTTPPKELAG